MSGAAAPTATTQAAGEGRERVARSRTLLAFGLLGLLALLVLLLGVSLVVGSGDAGLDAVLRTLFGQTDAGDQAQLVVQEVRIPRTAAGLLAGVALGLAGGVMQGVARNPLADPSILGVNAGASLAVVFALSVLGVTESGQYIWFGFLGAALAAVLVYGIGSLGRDGATPLKLALAGAATTAALTSFTTALLLTDSRTFDQYRFWQVGSLTGRETEALWQALPFVVVGVVLALALAPQLNALALGDDLARGLGQRIGLARAVAGGTVVLLCGGAVVVAGPIGFVGLVVPHAARLLTGPDYRWVLPYSALLAPLLVLGSDVVGRLVARPGEVQVGVVTAAIGAIPFVVLVRRRKLAEL